MQINDGWWIHGAEEGIKRKVELSTWPVNAAGRAPSLSLNIREL